MAKNEKKKEFVVKFNDGAYAGMNGTTTGQLRFAKIYHDPKWAREAADSILQNRACPGRTSYKLVCVELRETGEEIAL